MNGVPEKAVTMASAFNDALGDNEPDETLLGAYLWMG